MADKFVLTAQLQLQAPTNVNQVLNQVRSQLSRGNTNIQANVQTTGMAQANKQMQNLSKSAQSASTSMKSANNAAGGLVKTLGAAARRFAAITVATGTFLAIARSIGEATRKAIEFEAEMIKISQVTGKSLKSLQGLNREVTKIATNMGVSSQEILSASRTLLQAGFSADKVTKSLKILAQTDLAATFDSIQDTTEGAIALLRQFRNEAIRAGGDVKFLEQSLNAINAVSKNFAVESADLITVIRKTGGVFEAAGGSLNELLALFTSVRATTRESADTIAVGFRTIFTRIQRTETIEQLKELGIVLQDSTGKFVGPLEAIKRLQAGLSSLDPRDYRFAEIVEQLGGFRQIGKVIPLLKQYGTTAEALAIANAAAGENAADAAKAQQGLGNQVTKLKEKFDALIRTFVDGKTFKSLAAGAIALAEAFIRIAESLEPLLPMLTTLLSLKLGQLALPAIGKFAMGGGPRGFNKGGLVPGQGNFDTVPAMLTPGEFVMRKSAVKNIGASSMASMNARGYAAGGKVSGTRNFYGNGPIKQDDKLLQRVRAQGQAAQTGKKAASVVADSTVATFTPRRGAGQAIGLVSAEGTDTNIKSTGSAEPFNITNDQVRKFVHQKRISAGRAEKGSPVPTVMRGQIGPGEYDVFHPNLTDIKGGIGGAIDTGVRDGLGTAMQSAIKRIESSRVLDIPPAMQTDEKIINRFTQPLRNDKQVVSTMAGYMFEGVLGALSGASVTGGAEFFDFPASVFGTVKPKVAKIFGDGVNVGSKAELKRKKKKLYGADGIVNKVENDLLKSGYTSQSGLKLTGFNRGGGVSGSDTVPAMLTPGEFVINKKSASGIGYANLQRMNQSGGVKGYAAGGIVTPSRYNYGSTPPGQSAMASGQMAQNMMMLAMTVGMVTSSLSGLSEETQNAINTFGMTASMGLMLVNTLKEMGTSMAANIMARKASTAAETQESLANKQAAVGEISESLANERSALSEQQKAAANQMTGVGAAFQGLGIGAMIGVVMYAAFEGFAASFATTARRAFEEGSELMKEAIESAGAGNIEEAERQRDMAMVKIVEALEGEQDAERMSNVGTAGGIAAVVGGVIGGIVGFFGGGGVGAVPGYAAGAAIAGGAAAAATAYLGTDTSTNLQEEAATSLLDSIFNMAAGMAQFNNEIMLIKESGLKASEAMARLRNASDIYQNRQEAANQALKRYQSLLADETAKGDLADSEKIEQLVQMEADQRAAMVAAAKGYAQNEREVRQALIDDLAAGGGDIGEIFNDPRIRASREAYIKFLAQAMGGGENAIKEATKVADEIDKVKKEEIAASRKAAQAAREAAAARLQEIQLIREHNGLMHGLNQMLNQLNASAQQLSATQGILNNEFKKMPTAAADALATAISDFEGTTVEEYVNALDAATSEAPQRVKEAANRSAFYKKLFAAAEDTLEDLVGDAGQLEGAAGLDGSGPSSDDVQAKFRTAFADVLKDLPPEIKDQVNANLKEAAEDGIISPDEFEQILDPIKDAAERGAAAAKLYLQAQEQYLQDYLDASNALVAQIQRESEARANVIDVEERGRRRIQEATGRRPDRAARERARVNAARVRLGDQGNLVGDIAALRDSIIANRSAMNNNNQRLKDNNKRVRNLDGTFKRTGSLTVEERKKLASENVRLAQESANATAELKRLADQSERAADVMADIEAEREKRQAVQDSIKEFTFATNEGRADINKSFYALSRVLQTGNLNSIPDDLRASVGGILDQFKDIQIFGGMTGSDISKQLQIQTMDQQMRLIRGRGLTDEEKKTIFEATPAEEQFIQELRAINAEEVAAAKALAAAEQANTEMMTQLLTKIDGLLTALKAEFEARPMASGGLVAYKAGGGSIFKPRGTDTVPAMLTPGEFVIKKSAVNKVGVGALSAINNGGSPVYKAEGGLVGGSDAIRMTARNMGIAKIRELYGIEGAKAFKDNDVAALIEASGQEKSPFGQMSKILDVMAQYTDMFSSMSAEGIALKPGMQARFDQMIAAMGAAMPDGLGGIESLRQYNPGFFAGMLALDQIGKKILAGENAPSVEGQFGATASAASGNKLTKEEARKNRAKLFKEKREKDMQANAKFRTEKANEVYRDRLMNTPDETGMSPNERIARRAQAEKDAIQKEKLRAEGLATHNFSSNASESDIALMKKYGQYKSWEAMAAQVKARMDEKRETAQSFDQRYSGEYRSDEQKEAHDATLAARREEFQKDKAKRERGEEAFGLGLAKKNAAEYERNYKPVLDSRVMAEIDKFVGFVAGDPFRHGATRGEVQSPIDGQTFNHKGAYELVEGYFNNRVGGLWSGATEDGGKYTAITKRAFGDMGSTHEDMLKGIKKEGMYGDGFNPLEEKFHNLPVKIPIGFFPEGGAAIYAGASRNFSGDNLIRAYLTSLEDGNLRNFVRPGEHGDISMFLQQAYEEWKQGKTDAGQAKDVAAVEDNAYRNLAARISQDKGKPIHWGLISALGLSDRETDLVDEHQHLFDRINYAINSGQSIKPEDLERNYSSFQRTGFADSYRRDHVEAAKAYLKYIDARESVGFAREKRAEENDQQRLRDRINAGTNDGEGYLRSHDPFSARPLANEAVNIAEAEKEWEKLLEDTATGEFILGGDGKLEPEIKLGIKSRSQELSNSTPPLFRYGDNVDQIQAYVDWFNADRQQADKLLHSDYPYNSGYLSAKSASIMDLGVGATLGPYQGSFFDIESSDRLMHERAQMKMIEDKKKVLRDKAKQGFVEQYTNPNMLPGPAEYAKRYATGGAVDTVPAMLTPGEFVMNNSAVSKYGTGFMKALNQGRVQGFNKGGVVYAANGSQGGVSGGSGVDNIMGGNSDQLERIAQTFALVMKAFTSVASIFGNMSMTHQVNFGGSIKIDFPNADMISASIAQGAAAQISQMVDEKIESAIENLQNGPG